MIDVDFSEEVVTDAERIPGTAAERRARITVRRLSERILFVELTGYQCTVVLGPESALVVDPLDEGRAARLIEVIRERFAREVSTVVYSHAHADHVSGTAAVIAGSRHPVPVRVHAVAECAANVERRAQHVVPDVRHDDGGELLFEGVPMTLTVIGGHTADSTLVLFPEDGVAHAVDLVHPGQAEFFDLGGATDLWSYERALGLLLDADWRVLTAGHGQLGRRDDVLLVQEYLGELRAVTTKAVARALADAAPSPDVANARVDALRHRIRDAARPQLLENWASRLEGLEYTVDSHIGRMADELLYFS